MSTVRGLHSQAMDLAQQAFIARESGDTSLADELARQSMTVELRAAQRLAKEPSSEPTRSILYRSAASLAYQAHDYATAQRLVFEGLSGYPPPRIEQELKDLYEQINLTSHLVARGATIEAGQVQLALTGDHVGTGQIVYTAFQERINAVITLVDRTMRRLMGEEYKAAGRALNQARPFVPLIASPRAGSFAVTLEVRQRINIPTPFLTSGQQVIDQVVSGIDLVQTHQMEELRRLVGDEKYYINFVSMAQQLAPDGDRVKMVGLTTSDRAVSFTLPKREVPIPVPSMPEAESPQDNRPRTYRGVLDEASASKGRLGFITDENQKLTLRVEEGMDDLVRTYFNRHVTISGRWERNNIFLLLSIEEVDE